MRIVIVFLIFFAAISPGCLPQQKKSSGNPIVLLTGPDFSHFRSVSPYPSWATDHHLEFAIERATSDAEVDAALATYYEDKARLAKLLQ